MSRFKSLNPFRELLNPVDIYSAQNLLLKIAFVSGIAPLKLSGACGSRKLEIHFFGFLILILHMSLFAFCYVRTITIHDSIVSYFFKTEISVLGDTLQLCTGLIGICTVFLYSFCKRQTFILWFHIMAKIDEQLKEIGVETDYKSTLKFIFLVLTVKFVLFNTYLIGSWFLFKMANLYPNYTCWVSFFQPHLIISIIVVLFLCFVKQMKHRFLLLNKVLKSLYQRNKLDVDQRGKIVRPCGICSFYNLSQKDTTEIVSQIAKIHDELCDACNLAEEYFTAQMLTTVAVCFLIIVFNTYYILGAIFGEANHGEYFNTFEFILFFSYQIAVHFASVFAIVFVSSAAARESEKTAMCVHKLLNVTTDEDLKVKLTQLSMQLMHRKVKFTACGLFKLDRTLIFTIVKSLSTYLIILVQFTFNERAKVEMLKRILEDMLRKNNLTISITD